ncbi:MAG TPA: LLM class flavin-dependent oxidoreductase, partial [Luteimonas sp.]|nr:LLM class flavin-dependent oxidoreductase [Luteimonas sp.]
ARLLEAVTVMRALWRGDEVTHAGLFHVQRARLYSLPATPPPVYIAALSEDTARWAGAWADGLITVNLPLDTLRRVLDAFREGGGAGKPVCLQVKVSYDLDDASALAGAHEQWRTNVFGSDVSAGLRMPSQYDAAARFVRPEDMHDFVRISSDPQRHAAWLHEYASLGFDRIYLHNVNRQQERFIDAFGDLLPKLRQSL